MFKIEGRKLVGEALLTGAAVHSVFALADWLEINGVSLNDKGIDVFEINASELRSISELDTPQDVIALVQIPEGEEANRLAPFALALEAIRDPGNLGTIIRLADWYGLSEVYCSHDCVDAYNPKTVQATMGSIFRVRPVYTDLASWAAEQQMPVYAAMLDGGTSLYDFTFPEKSVLLIGNESAGVSEEMAKIAAGLIFIPRFGGAESLNAAIAAGIFLDHWKQAAHKNQ
ncbi:MAG: RNA methyltransferase [Bacteroidota bacterium]|nr:RNA methyltransferase [Bacteroidota bacterium]